FRRGIGAQPVDTLNHGNYYGAYWIPAECDVSIRPGWFYHSAEDDKLKSPQQLFQLYLKSVGRGANMLLNVPPNQKGLISEVDSAALMGFKLLREESFNSNLLKQASTYYEFTDKDLSSNDITLRSLDSTATTYSINVQNFIVQLQQSAKVNCIVLREAIHLGQTIRKFNIVLYNGSKVVRQIPGTSVGRKRILTFPATTITSFKVNLVDAQGNDNVSGVAAYLIDEGLVEK
ncbi:MAG: alpha-L-fucosidase, partial [Bacteroidota bacterium]